MPTADGLTLLGELASPIFADITVRVLDEADPGACAEHVTAAFRVVPR